MNRWRVVLALSLAGLVGVPAAMPFAYLLTHSQGWQAWAELGRLTLLARNTFQLVAGTLALAMPVGILGAVLLYRTDLPFRRGLRFLTLITLFIPLPLFTSAWQAALGTGGWLPLTMWNNEPGASPEGQAKTDFTAAPRPSVWQPWAHGVSTAMWVHAVAGLPWVIVLVGQALCWVERELEEDALTVVGPWQVLWKVTLPRCRAALFAAGLWIALFATTEITVTDMMQVRTFAEEVYTEFVAGDRGAPLARAVAISVPMILVTWGMTVLATSRWQRLLPPLETLATQPLLIRLGRARWPCLIVALLGVGLLAGVPLASLIWKAGLAGSPPAWSAQVAGHHLLTACRARSGLVAESLLLAAIAGGLAAVLGLVICWLATESRWFQAATLGLMAVVWALSAPLIGIGLGQTIDQAIHWIPFRPLEVILYYGPSPVPTLWAYLIRFFPCAVAILWPVVRLLPRELRDAARVDGARPLSELSSIVVPLTAPACWRAGIAVGILALGELGASKLAATPGSSTFAMEVFGLMHYGVSNDLAALCLLLLAAIVLGSALLIFSTRRKGQPCPIP
jgi:iron(III) transport system permease protein